MDFSQIGERVNAWQAAETAKRKAMRERLVHIQPFRETMVRRILTVSIFALPVQMFLLLRVAMGAPLGAVIGAMAAPAVWLLAAACCLRWGRQQWRVPAATGQLFAGITFAAVIPQATLAGVGGYPQYGGVLLLTILLCGLLIGEFYVGAWTLVCCGSFQYAINENAGWEVNVAWSVVYVVAAWMIIQFSRHLERLYEANRLAEERQRSAIVAERTRFARDIHDTLAEGFSGIVMQLNAADQESQQEHEEETRRHIEKAKQLASRSLAEARRSVSALRSSALASGTLLDGIEQIVCKLTTDLDGRFETKIEGQPYALPPKCEANVLQLAKESLTDAVQHPGAPVIPVLLAYRTGSVVLEIGDGRQAVGGALEPGSQVNEDIRILTDPGRGTRIIVTVPNA